MKRFIEMAPYGTERAAHAPIVSDTIDHRVLAASTAELHTIPSGAGFVLINVTQGADLFVKFGDNTVVAAVPAADVTDGTGSLHVATPQARRIPAGATHVSLIASDVCTATLEWYA